MSSIGKQQHQMAFAAFKEAQLAVERIFMVDAKDNDGVRGPADTCFCKGCGFSDCDHCNKSVEVK